MRDERAKKKNNLDRFCFFANMYVKYENPKINISY